ncbi:MAG: hypothetical protein RI894_2280 [Bacteroidota bacterium]|jgi:hypothetical protein
MKKIITHGLALSLPLFAFSSLYAQSTLFTTLVTQQFSAVRPASQKVNRAAVIHEDLIRPQSPIDTVQAVGSAHRIVVRIGNETIESNVFVVSHEFNTTGRNNELPLATFEREHSHLVLSTED